eukprot:gene9685-3069_t
MGKKKAALVGKMSAEEQAKMEELKKKRQFKKFKFRGLELEALLDKNLEQMAQLYTTRVRRKLDRGLRKKAKSFVFKIRDAITEAKKEFGAKPKCVRTHLRDMVIMPDMVNSVVGIYNGKQFNEVEIKGEMLGHYLGEFSMTYKPVRHGRPGIGATHSSRFIPLK